MTYWNDPVYEQVRARIDPELLESPRGYLCRIAGCFGFPTPRWITELAGFEHANDLEDPEKVDQLARTLRLESDEWRSLAYLRVQDSHRFQRRQFSGQLIAANRLNYSSPRVCPACLRERAIWWGIWDIALVTVCPGHRCELIASCQKCHKQLRWDRPGVEVCDCGFDLREIEALEAEPELVAVNAAIYRSAGFPVGMGFFDLGNEGFPFALENLTLDALTGLITAFASFVTDDSRMKKPALTDIETAMLVANQAANVLSKWPSRFHSRLQKRISESVSSVGAITFRSLYGDFYQYILDTARQLEFAFLTDAFNDYVAQFWPGLLRGQHRTVPQATHSRRRLIPIPKAAKLAGLTTPQITDLVRKGTLAGIFVAPTKSTWRIECWLDSERLARWIEDRNADFSEFISQKEAMCSLGLTSETIRRLAQIGLLEICKGPCRGFPPGVHLRRQNVERIVAAFKTTNSAGLREYRSDTILLREALRRYLGRKGFGEFVRAVISGDLQPKAQDSTIRGILGYRFRVDDVKKYSPGKPKYTVPAGMMTYEMAAVELGTNTEVVRNLVAMGKFCYESEQPGGVRLLHSRDVVKFASEYVSVKSIAVRFDVGSLTMLKALKQMGAKVLVVPLPGKGNKLFVRKSSQLVLVCCEFKRGSGSIQLC